MTILTMFFAAACCSGTAAATDALYSVGHQPNICDLYSGRYCLDCDSDPTTRAPECIGEDEGWLCCVGSICVEAEYDDECPGGDVGWCESYWTTTLPNGVEVAYCES